MMIAKAKPITSPGWKTTEFWLNLLAVIVAYLAASGFGDDETSWVARAVVGVSAVLATLGYTASRAVVKRETIRRG